MELETKSAKPIILGFMEHHHEWIKSLPASGHWHLGATDEHLWFKMTPKTDLEPLGKSKDFHCIAINTDLCEVYRLTDEEIEAMLCQNSGGYSAGRFH